MGKSDKWVNIILLAFIVVHLVVLITGLARHKLFLYAAILNAVCGFTLIAYWVQKQLSIRQHHLELREICVLSLEALVVGLSVYAIATNLQSNWLKTWQYIVFSIHFLLFLLAMAFMLTFKMNRLF